MTREQRAYKASASFVEVENYTANTLKITLSDINERQGKHVIDVIYRKPCLGRKQIKAHRQRVTRFILKHYKEYFRME